MALFVIIFAIWSLAGCQNQLGVQLVDSSCDFHWTMVGVLDVDVPRPDGKAACLINLEKSPQRWIWSKNSSRLFFSLNNLGEEIIYYIKNIGEKPHKSLSIKGSRWWLSPDGTYIVTSSLSPSYGSGSRVINAETGEEICRTRFASGGIGSFSTCNYLQLEDGQWWHFNTGIVASKKNDALARKNLQLVDSSPDNKWILLGYQNYYTDSGLSLSLYHKESEKVYFISQPYIGKGPLCAYLDSTRWGPNSKHFALYDKSQGYLFIWSIDQEGESSPLLIHTEKSDCIHGTPIEWPAAD